MSLNAKQTEQLLRGINPKRVLHNRGQSHLAGWDVEAHLTRIFGFEGWDKRVRSIDLVFEDGVQRGNSDRVGWYVTYRCLMTLIIKDPQGNVIREIDDGATGSAENQPQRGEAHDLAYKNAITYALKRCAKDLGDQFGLSLYNGGSAKPIILQTLASEQGDVEDAVPDEVHPDTDASGEPETHDAQPGPLEPSAVITPQAPAKPADDPVLGQWAMKLDEITSQDDVNKALEDVDREQRGGVLDSRRANAIRRAVQDKAAGFRKQGGNGQAPSRQQRPSAEDRGAQAVPTGKGDDGPWVTGFMQRLAAVTDPDDLGPMQSQIGNAVKAKTITPAKSADLSKAIRERRNELQSVPA